MNVLDKPSLAAGPAVVEVPKPGRQDWVDNLRTLMIVLVVNMHACVTYTHVGDWYYNSPPEPSIAEKIPFAIWQGHLQAFFMGLLFFLAGYYADRSLARKGAGDFLKERWVRLGIPTLIYMLAIHPLIVLVLHPGYQASANPWGDYFGAITSGRFLGNSGPMWFAFALLIFCVALAPLANRLPKVEQRPVRLTVAGLLGLGVALGLASFLVRTVQPIGSSILNFQFCFFAQYIVAFGLGIWISRRNSLSEIASSPLAKKAGIAALILGPIALIGVFLASQPIPEHGPVAFQGGWHGTALGYAMWEQIAGVCLAVGAMALCASRFNVRTRLSAWLSDRSFAVYMLHAPVLVATSLVLQPVRRDVGTMVAVVTVVGLAVSFAIADFAKRLPGLRKIL